MLLRQPEGKGFLLTSLAFKVEGVVKGRGIVELKITDASCCKLNTTPLKPWLVAGVFLLQNRTSGVCRNNTSFFLDLGAGQRIIIPIKFRVCMEMGEIDMWEIEKNFKVKIGGNYFINCESLISYHDTLVHNKTTGI